MGRGTAAAVGASVLALGVAALLLLSTREERPPPSAPEAPRPAERRRRAPRPPAPAVPQAPSPPAPPLDPVEEEFAQEEMLAYPEGAAGPVVVGRVTLPGDADPECWIALESVEAPSRRDPSRLESLPGGRFRLTGFAAGRYRVRAKDDDAPAAYSREFAAVDGRVADAGVIPLRRPACLAGIVQDPSGREVAAKVRLLGRDPSSLEPGVVAVVDSIPLQGFQVEPHEAGPYEIAVEADEGWAVQRGRTDDAGFGGVKVRLLPWGALRADPGPGARVERIVVEARAAPPLGRAARTQTVEGPGPVDRLPAGTYAVRIHWRAKEGAEEEPRISLAEATVEAGRTAEVPVHR